MRKLFERMNEILAARALRSARDDVDAAQSKVRFSLTVANVLAALILSTPLWVATASAGLLWVSHGTVLGWILAALLLCFAWVLVPRRPRNTQPTYGREDLPELFELVDQVCSELGAPQIDGVHLMTDMNAYLFEYRPLFGRKHNILGLGLTLWYALEPQERLALIAHEVGHLVNRDPGRGVLIGYGMQVMARWADWLQPNSFEDAVTTQTAGGMIVNTLLEILGYVFLPVWKFLQWSMMYHSQIAEYVADARSVEIAGKGAVQQLLFYSILNDEAERSLRGMIVRHKPKDGWIFDHIATAIRKTSDERKAQHIQTAEAQKSSVDQSHPPTVYRIAFIDELPDAAARLEFGKGHADAIDASLVPYKDALGAQLLRRIEVY